MDHKNHFESQNTVTMIECGGAAVDSQKQWKQMKDDERNGAVQEEMKRMHQLPSNSSYATHRLRVLNKILQLMSIQKFGPCAEIVFRWEQEERKLFINRWGQITISANGESSIGLNHD
ncbi:unnamed protein product [Amaranthus hypochondriacus]